MLYIFRLIHKSSLLNAAITWIPHAERVDPPSEAITQLYSGPRKGLTEVHNVTPVSQPSEGTGSNQILFAYF